VRARLAHRVEIAREGSRVAHGTARAVGVRAARREAVIARRKGIPGICAVVACLVAIDARAQTASGGAEGFVVQVETDDLVVDLGASRGIANDDVVEIWRPLRLRHPVTGAMMTDRFLIGRLRLVQVRPTLSLAKPEGQLSRAPQAGDVIVLARSHGPATPPPPEPSTAPPAPAAGGDESAALSELFDSLRGADVPARIRAYEEYVYAHPHARYVTVLWEEAKNLRKLLASPVHPPVPGSGSTPPTAEVQSFDRVVAGEPLRIALALRGETSGAVLHARQTGQETYASRPMAKVGAEYWAATVPGDAIRAPGLEWFVEAVTPEGTLPVVGDPAAPETAEVQDVRPATVRRVLGQAQIWTDYASFNAKANNDYVWQTEGVMGARFDDEGIRALRTGFGVYRGVGGTLDQLDVQHRPGAAVGLTYGYLESEFGLSPRFSIAARALIGLREDGVNGGASAFVRIGSDLETNLLIGGEVLGGIGLRGITEFDWNSFKNVPIVFRSEVTNQPAGTGSDVGVRLIGQAGYRFLPHLVVAGRVSYQGRTINHAGPGVGAAVEYAW
jgi:hypothetical protein